MVEEFWGRNISLLYSCCRFNLDPEQLKSDEELWQALEIAQLKSTVTSLPGKLGT